MAHSLKVTITGALLLAGATQAHAQTATNTATGAGFDNILIRSPSVVSPSQHYQVERGRFEGDVAIYNGNVDYKSPAAGDNTDLKGTEFGLGGFYAVAPQAVVGLTVDYNTNEANNNEATSVDISPSIAYSLTPMFSLGLAAHLVSGSEEAGPNDEDVDTDFNYFTLGATMHEGPWEGTLVFSSENEDDNKPQNNQAQAWGLHGRYRFAPTLALGLSIFQKDTSALAAGTNAEDETAYGLHLETDFAEGIGAEFAFFSTADVDGAQGTDETEFFAMGHYAMNPTMKVGARLSYITADSNTAETDATRIGIFVASDF